MAVIGILFLINNFNNMNLELPLAKTGDSVIVFIDDRYKDVIIDDVQALYDRENEEYFWAYFMTGRDGTVNALYDVDILMNLTTREKFTASNEKPEDVSARIGDHTIEYPNAQTVII